MLVSHYVVVRGRLAGLGGGLYALPPRSGRWTRELGGGSRGTSPSAPPRNTEVTRWKARAPVAASTAEGSRGLASGSYRRPAVRRVAPVPSGGGGGDVPLAPPRSARVHLPDQGGRACNPPPPVPGQTAPTDHIAANQQKRPLPPPPRTDPTPLLAPTSKGGVGSLAASPPSCTPPGWVGPRSSGGYCGGGPQYIP